MSFRDSFAEKIQINLNFSKSLWVKFMKNEVVSVKHEWRAHFSVHVAKCEFICILVLLTKEVNDVWVWKLVD